MTNIKLSPTYPASSLIAEDGWNDDATILAVRFHNGKVYEYRGLTEDHHEGYEGAASRGKYLKGTIEKVCKGIPV